MACPYFEPGERLPLASGSLGDLYSGRCRADGAGSHIPDAPTLAERCNIGYARGVCTHFPPCDGPDAVRFSVSRPSETGIRILYSMESDHRPLSAGSLEYSTVTGAFEGEPPEALARLAQAYIRSYLRRA